METLGQFLKREREFRQISLEVLSRNTKINSRFLESLENDQWDGLPKGAFIKGFLKVYAQQLDLPLDEVMKRFEGQSPKKEGEDPFKKFRGVEVKNRFFLFLVFIVGLILLAAYLSSR